MRRVAALLSAGLLSAGLIFFAGCASKPPRSSRLTASDYTYTVNETVNQLVASDFFASRGMESPKAVVSIERVTNLSSDIIPEGEQWMFVHSVWSSPEVKQLARSKNVVTQVSQEGYEKIVSMLPQITRPLDVPTHVMSAVINTSTRTGLVKAGVANARVDQYQIEYTIRESSSGTIAWSSIVEFKREALGNPIN
jgi:hypothetical protein